MKSQKTVCSLTTLLFVAAIVVLLEFLVTFRGDGPQIKSFPKRWIRQGTVLGKVIHVGNTGITVRFSEKEEYFFPSETGFTNGQSVYVSESWHYVQKARFGRPKIEWAMRNISPEHEGWIRSSSSFRDLRKP